MNRTSRSIALLGVFASACDMSLLDDPSFDLWCGEKLCTPWESTGSIERVKTWHRSDYGVELLDGSSLSQLSTRPDTSCIQLGLIADVAASAEVRVEIDFNDDGSSEFRQIIPESRWAVLNFEVHTPGNYKNMRFTLRKAGRGRAVIAQVSMTAGCPPVPLPDKERGNGVQCNYEGQCAGGACEARFDYYRLDSGKVCGECGATRSCPEGLHCGSALAPDHLYAACVPPQELGAACEEDAECASEHCALTVGPEHPTCGACVEDGDCPSDQVCGLSAQPLGPARRCVEARARTLGAACLGDSQCQSGLCYAHTCQQCDDAHPCADGQCMQRASDELQGWLAAVPNLCIRAMAAQREGEVCNRSEDCESGVCDRADSICYYCSDMECQNVSLPRCPLRRQLAGVCR